MKKLYIVLTFILTLVLVGCSNDSGGSTPHIIIEVEDYGKMELVLYRDVAPISVDNFLSYIDDNEYEGSSFHRVINNFMIQGGRVENTKAPIKGEFETNGFKNNLAHDRGVISMARTGVKDSATSQFFIVHEDSPHLDGKYAAFGALVEGFDVLDDIANVVTNPGDEPVELIKIISIKRK